MSNPINTPPVEKPVPVKKYPVVHDSVNKETIEQRKAILAGEGATLSGYKVPESSKAAFGAIAGSPSKEVTGSQTAKPATPVVGATPAIKQEAAKLDEHKTAGTK